MAKKTLGRGLQALLGSEGPDEAGVAVAEKASYTSTDAETLSVAIDEIDPNPYQPRRDFDPEEIAALAQTVSAHGIIQPVVVRSVGDRFQIIAGERRLRAAQEAGLRQVPVRILDVDEQQSFEFALIENLQRKDLNPIEKAYAFQQYIGQFGATHEELAAQLGVDRSTVTNLIRLLELPDSVQEAVRAGQISNGHARALLSVDDPIAQIALCRQIIEENLSVRQTEQLVKQQKPKVEKPAATTSPSKPSKSNHILALETDLRRRLGAKVEIAPKTKDSGSIIIHFESNDDFERVVEILNGGERA